MEKKPKIILKPTFSFKLIFWGFVISIISQIVGDIIADYIIKPWL